jgi:hypothetical protein
MKHMARGIVFSLVALATPVIVGGEPPKGVAGVDVIVQKRPRDSVITDAHGNFAVEALAAGSYALTFRARNAEKLHQTTSDKVIVATVYSIRIEGTKQAVTKTGLTTNDLIAGVDIKVNLGPGARIRGRVVSGALKKMVWIPKEPGSNLPGRWVEEDSDEAKAALHHNSSAMNIEAVRQIQR